MLYPTIAAGWTAVALVAYWPMQRVRIAVVATGALAFGLTLGLAAG